MTSRRLVLGEGARCSVLLSKLRPSQVVKTAFPNRLPTQRLDDLVAVRHEQITRRGLTYDGVFFSSESIPGVELSAALRFVLVKEQGPEESFWDAPPASDPSAPSPAQAVPVMMATGGALLADENCKEATRSWMENGVAKSKKFNYAKPFDWHFKYRHAVDDHNNLRHALPSIEDGWRTIRWENRVFSFVLAVSEINAYLFLRYFVCANWERDNVPTLLMFRRKLAWKLINNQWIGRQERHVNIPIDEVHSLLMAPKHARNYKNRRWICDAKCAYQQYRCSMHCGKRIRTFCACSPGVWICTACHVNHVLNEVEDP